MPFWQVIPCWFFLKTHTYTLEGGLTSEEKNVDFRLDFEVYNHYFMQPDYHTYTHIFLLHILKHVM